MDYEQELDGKKTKNPRLKTKYKAKNKTRLKLKKGNHSLGFPVDKDGEVDYEKLPGGELMIKVSSPELRVVLITDTNIKKLEPGEIYGN